MKYDVFISYRRDGGDILAMLLYNRLKDDGYNPFYDIETLRSGRFNEQLYDKIAECDDFICVLPPHALDRCTDENDWVRKEIEKALELKKNIVPVLMRGFEFPKQLPAVIDELRFYQGIAASSEFFEETYTRLKRLLTAKVETASKKTVQGNAMIDLLEEVYQKMIDFREALQLGDQTAYDSASKSMQEVMQKVYNYGERNISSPEAGMLRYIIDEYNKFADSFKRFSAFRGRQRMSDAAQQCAQIAENQFNDLLKFIIEQISQDETASKKTVQENSLIDLLEEVYQKMIDFRRALQLGDQTAYDSASRSMQDVMQKVYNYGERHISSPEADMSKYIIDEYNKFTDSFNRFSAFRGRQRMSDSAQQYAQIAENQFNNLLKYVIEQISNVSHS